MGLAKNKKKISKFYRLPEKLIANEVNMKKRIGMSDLFE